MLLIGLLKVHLFGSTCMPPCACHIKKTSLPFWTFSPWLNKHLPLWAGLRYWNVSADDILNGLDLD